MYLTYFSVSGLAVAVYFLAQNDTGEIAVKPLFFAILFSVVLCNRVFHVVREKILTRAQQAKPSLSADHDTAVAKDSD